MICSFGEAVSSIICSLLLVLRAKEYQLLKKTVKKKIVVLKIVAPSNWEPQPFSLRSLIPFCSPFEANFVDRAL
jgi:hypothetical protein